jgi:hypothetical protein
VHVPSISLSSSSSHRTGPFQKLGLDRVGLRDGTVGLCGVAFVPMARFQVSHCSGNQILMVFTGSGCLRTLKWVKSRTK